MESGRNLRRFDIEPEASGNLSAPSAIPESFIGVCSSILPSGDTSLSCCEDFFLPDNDSLLAMFRSVRGEDVGSLLVVSLHTSAIMGVVGVTGELDTIP